MRTSRLEQSTTAERQGISWRSLRHRLLKRFSIYSALSLVTVPVGLTLLIGATHLFPHVNAGLLSLAVGTVLTPPSFVAYRQLVWKGGNGRSVWAELFSFWQTVMVGAAVSSALVGAADALLDANGLIYAIAVLAGQGLVFVARFFWLDRVTFTASAPVDRARINKHGAPESRTEIR